MDNYNDQWPYTGMTHPRAAGRYGLEEISPHMEIILRSIESLEAQNIQNMVVMCEYCAESHSSHVCSINFEATLYGGNFGNYPNYAYPNNYHQDVGYQPEFSWSGNNQVQTLAPGPSYTLEFHDQAPIQEERKSKIEELLYKFMASNDEMMQNQEMLIRNLENQIGELTIAFNNRYQEGWPSDLVPETDGLPTLKLQPDVLFDNDSDMEETSGEQEKEAKDLALSSNLDEPKLIVLHESSPPKLKDSGSFAVPCPLGSHVIGEALCDIRASIELDPWCEDVEVHEKKADGSIVCEELQFTNPSTDTMEQSPSFVQFIDENVSKSYKLGDLDVMTPTEVNASNVTWLPRNGGFLKFRRGIG